MSKLRVLDLFSGIGGFSLGLERTGGFETVAFCEIEEFPRKVLKKHWPEVPCYHDVRELTAARLAADGIAVDVICGGFPCQDISTAGKGVGIAGERSGLWKEYARLIGELRPRFVLVENVAALLGRGLDVVLGDLAQIGYDAEWHCISASAVGAPHRRDRIWIIANPSGRRCREPGKGEIQQQGRTKTICASQDVANACRSKRHRWSSGSRWWSREPLEALQDARLRGGQEDGLRLPESQLGRVAYGIPDSVERLGALGNAVVPQIPELIGNAILQSLKQEQS
jgi:DNA (cytosine-5)-methyltransferase 1